MNIPILLLSGTFITNYHFKFGRFQISPRWATECFPISNGPCEGLSKFTNFSWSFDTRTALSHVWWFTVPNWSQESGRRRVESESLLFVITCFSSFSIVKIWRVYKMYFKDKNRSLPKHTIVKVKFLSKNSILTKPQHFHEFFTKFFFDNFSREIKVVNS